METVFDRNCAAVNKTYHVSVLKQELLDLLKVKPGRKYIDATLGGGGFALEIINRGGIVLGIDCDQEAIDYVREKFSILNFQFLKSKKLILVKGNFKDLVEIAKSNGFEKVAGIVFDLGTSRHQLTGNSRGFSFKKDEDLDMRMDKSQEISAKEIINTKSERELYEIFTKYGEEKLAGPIASAVGRARRIEPITNTRELAEIIRSVKKGFTGIDAATKVFQALRIGVNNELENLKKGLGDAENLLQRQGIMAVISFHSLEDRIVKNFFRNQAKSEVLKILTKKPITAAKNEIKINPASRSAKLRAAVKIN
ncbi:MAG: 16S rRNA (cytosine(1402)-N(4))-methyltransferase RsmH [Patescibacteria group bacterium]|nr:16S rRNA (cytosine(1402)-N(4))-methyltransferase RsmH [Patescibacteria group bacterium]